MDNISVHNESTKKRYLEMIKEVLAKCRSSKLKFSRIAHLRGHVQEQCGIHRTTLTRSVDYSALLHSYMKTQPGAVSFVEDNLDIGVMETKLLLLQAENGNLRREVRRLKLLAVKVQGSEAALEIASAGPGSAASHEPVEKVGEIEVALANAYMMLALVIGRAGVYAIDRSSRSIYDMAVAPGSASRVIAERARAAAFISWIEKNQTLMVARAVPTGSESDG